MVTAVTNSPVGFSDSGDQASSKALLRVVDLKVSIPIGSDHPIHPVDGVSFQVAAGEAVGLLGESGAGKTTLARALMRLLPASSRVDGVVEFDGVPLLSLGKNALRSFRGDRISLVHQDSSGLNPVRRVGDQLVDVLRAHRPWSRKRCREKAVALLAQMDFDRVARIYSAYPHQLSGGERQRIVVAQALICRPSLVIADEPTASVDSDTASQILRLCEHAKDTFGGSIILISHDVNVLAQVVDTIMVMYAGRIVERGSVERVLNHPRHPYTCALLKCSDLTNLNRTNTLRLPTIAEPLPGSPDSPPGEDCEKLDMERIDIWTSDSAEARCRPTKLWPVASDLTIRASQVPESSWLLEAIDLSKSYVEKSRWNRKPLIKALDHVSVALPKGKTVAVIGRSGSGKTTLAMCLALLEEPDTGSILFEGGRIQSFDRAGRRAMRRQIQIIFQDSVMALSPRLTTTQLVEEPLIIQKCVTAHERAQLARRLLEQVGIPQASYTRRAHELSGGQRQRVAIARSLALNPSLLILDEPFVGLDAPIRNQIVNLFRELQKIHDLTYLYISHDLAVVRYFADATLMMDHGKLSPSGDTRACSN